MRAEDQVRELESMLHVSVHKVGRAVRNMRQEMGGYPSRTPGSGAPGGGKGARSEVSIVESPGARLPASLVDGPDGVRVPVTSVESAALGLTGRDEAADALARLTSAAMSASSRLAGVLELVGRDPGPDWSDRCRPGADRLVVLTYARLRRLLDPTPPKVWSSAARSELRRVDREVDAIYHTVGRWSYTTKRPSTVKSRSELLAVDLTDMWCTSHLRAGEKRNRSRGELCDWCYRHGPLLVASWDAPPVELVRIFIDQKKVYAHQIDPFIRAARDRQRRLNKKQEHL